MTVVAKRTLLIASLSRIPKDGRVSRQINSLLRRGYKVIAFGYGRSHPTDPEPPTPAGLTLVDIALTQWGKADRIRAGLATAAAKVAHGERASLALAEQLPGVGALSRAISGYLSQLPPGAERPIHLIANDWTSLPAAIAAHRDHGLAFHYDSHEFAIEEHANSRMWRLMFPSLIKRIEAIGLARAASSSCPSEGIRQIMMATYAPRVPIVLIRNVPDATPLPPRPVGQSIEVLYHGLFKPDRGLVELAQGVAAWPSQYRLRLRGRAPDPAFAATLSAMAANSDGRIVMSDMVPLADVVTAANASDIGVFLPDIELAQNRHAFPNKLFEYLHAGLMVIAPAGTEMGELVLAGRSGLAIDTPAAALARVFSDLTPAMIAEHKANAAAAAAQLCWAVEETTLLDALALHQHA